MKTLNMISFVAMPFLVIVEGLLHNQIVWNVAIASIGAFALSGIICYISDLANELPLAFICIIICIVAMVILVVGLT
jgi:hypothetical protein